MQWGRIWCVAGVVLASPSVGASPLIDSERALYWCIGFYLEIKDQATTDNNTLLYNKAERNISSYVMELTVDLQTSPEVLEPEAENAARKQGAFAAGQVGWRMGGQAEREFILRTRYLREQTCDETAKQAELFRPQAEDLIDQAWKTFHPNDKGNSGKK